MLPNSNPTILYSSIQLQFSTSPWCLAHTKTPGPPDSAAAGSLATHDENLQGIRLVIKKCAELHNRVLFFAECDPPSFNYQAFSATLPPLPSCCTVKRRMNKIWEFKVGLQAAFSHRWRQCARCTFSWAGRKYHKKTF